MNLPNKITMLRVIMIPFFAFFMLTDMVEGSKYIAVAIFIMTHWMVLSQENIILYQTLENLWIHLRINCS